jgi:hypothetical protein
MNFSGTEEFKKDYKRLFRKYPTLREDLGEIKKTLQYFPRGTGKNFTVLQTRYGTSIIKARLYSKYLRNRSLRLIYAYHKETQQIEFIEFIELYFKGDKVREDAERIKEYLKNF